MATAVFCIATTEFQAEAIVNELKIAGFSDADISVLLTDKANLSTRNLAKASASGDTVGTLGWLPGIRAINLSGAGLLIATSQLLSALKEAGGIAPALAGMGLSASDAKRSEQKIRAGQILIAVHSERPEASNQASAIFKQAGITRLAVAVENETKDVPPEVRDETWERW